MTLLAAVLASLWLAQLVLALRLWRAVPTVASLKVSPLAAWPTLTVVVPARNEERHVEAALASKLACGYPALQVVAVDDRSTDRTLEQMQGLAAKDPRLTVVQVRQLPEGWLGKLNALAQGLSQAKGEWVLFSDADVHLEPGTLQRLVAHAEEGQLDFVSLFPKLDPVSLPVDACMVGLLRIMLLSGRAWRANDDRSDIGVGVGAFNLVRRSWLSRTCALERLRMEVADDVALGALLKQEGARTRFFASRARAHLVFQDSLGAVGRSAGKGGGMFGFVLWKPLLLAVLPTLVEVVLPLCAIASGGLAALLGAAALLLATLTHAALCLHFAGPLRAVALWPLGHLLMAAFTLQAGFAAWRRQGIVWRDTFYPRAVLEAGRVLELGRLRVRPSREGPSAQR